MASYGYTALDSSDLRTGKRKKFGSWPENGTVVPPEAGGDASGNALGGAASGAATGAMFGPWGAAAGAGIGLASSLMSSSKARKRAKAEAENARLEVDNQASNAKTGIDMAAKDQAGQAEQAGTSSGLYNTSAMDNIRRSIREGRADQFAGVDAEASRRKGAIGTALADQIRPGFDPEIADGAAGLVKSLGSVFPAQEAEKKVDPMAVKSGDPTLSGDSFTNPGDVNQSTAAYAAVDDPERVYKARIAYLRGGRRGDTGGSGGMT